MAYKGLTHNPAAAGGYELMQVRVVRESGSHQVNAPGKLELMAADRPTVPRETHQGTQYIGSALYL